jgi:hypothetical protein
MAIYQIVDGGFRQSRNHANSEREAQSCVCLPLGHESCNAIMRAILMALAPPTSIIPLPFRCARLDRFALADKKELELE